MRWTTWIGALAGLLTLAATPALAAPAAPVVCDTGTANGRQLAYPSGDMSRDMMLTIVMGTTASAPDYKLKALAKGADGCDRGVFQAGGRTYHLWGHDGAGAVRIAIPDGGGPIVYLAAFSDLTDEIEAGKTGQAKSPPKIRYALGVADEDGNKILAYFDAIPTDVIMQHAAVVVIEKGGSPIVGVDKKGAIVIYMSPDAYNGPSSAGQMLPKPGGAPGTPVASMEPQNGAFLKMDDGGVRHQLTGFVCPAELAGFKRGKLVVYDAAEGGRDVSCRFESGDSWFTLYFTRLPLKYSGEQVFNAYVDEAQQVAPPRARDADVASLIALGLPPQPTFGKFWFDRRGQVQGLWTTQIGQWHVKLRVTYDPKDSDKVRDFATAIYGLVYEEVKAPPI